MAPKSPKVTTPPDDSLASARKRVDDLRRKSIDLLNALDSPAGLADYDISPNPSEGGNESDSELSDLHEPPDLSNLTAPPDKELDRRRLVQNIQIPPRPESFYLKLMRRESEELLNAIKLEEATAATRTPANTPLASQTVTPMNTPVHKPQIMDDTLQRVRLELRKLSEDIMQTNSEPNPPEAVDNVKSVLVLRGEHSTDISPTGHAEDEMDSFEGLLEEERKGPLVDDMDDISDSLSDLEDAKEVDDSDEEPQSAPDAFKVINAGSPEFNGVYRWFTATSNYVKFAPGATYSMISEPFGNDGANMWYICRIDANNVLEKYYSSFHRGELPPERWQCVVGESPAPTLAPHFDRNLGES